MKVLMVIDMQKGFIKAQNAHLEKNINKLLNSKIFDRVIYTMFKNNKNSPFVKILNWTDMQDSEKQQIVVDIIPNSLIWEKQSYGLPTERIVDLKNNKVQEVYLCGTDIDACVLNIAYNLFDNNIKPIFISDCCDTSSQNSNLKDWTLKIISRSFGESCITETKSLI